MIFHRRYNSKDPVTKKKVIRTTTPPDIDRLIAFLRERDGIRMQIFAVKRIKTLMKFLSVDGIMITIGAHPRALDEQIIKNLLSCSG